MTELTARHAMVCDVDRRQPVSTRGVRSENTGDLEAVGFSRTQGRGPENGGSDAEVDPAAWFTG